jgi:hypothetical protein
MIETNMVFGNPGRHKTGPYSVVAIGLGVRAVPI